MLEADSAWSEETTDFLDTVPHSVPQSNILRKAMRQFLEKTWGQENQCSNF